MTSIFNPDRRPLRGAEGCVIMTKRVPVPQEVIDEVKTLFGKTPMPDDLAQVYLEVVGKPLEHDLDKGEAGALLLEWKRRRGGPRVKSWDEKGRMRSVRIDDWRWVMLAELAGMGGLNRTEMLKRCIDRLIDDAEAIGSIDPKAIWLEYKRKREGGMSQRIEVYASYSASVRGDFFGSVIGTKSYGGSVETMNFDSEEKAEKWLRAMSEGPWVTMNLRLKKKES